jgi:hypothetical protein
LAACGGQEASGNGLAQLVVRVDDDGDRGPDSAKQLTVDCERASQSAACGAAAKVTSADLAPTPGDRACSQLYGGPQTASIRGTLRGERVDATFSRVNGCEIARWGHVSSLLGEVR